MGLLDQFSEFAKTPEGQGLLSAAFGGLATAQRGAPLNSIGRAGMAGLAGYSGAIDRQQQQTDANYTNQMRQAQLKKITDEQAREAAGMEYLKTQNPTLLATGGNLRPTPENAQAVAQVDPVKQQMWELATRGVIPIGDYLKSTMPQGVEVKDYKEVRNADGSVSIVGLTKDGKVIHTQASPFIKPEVRDFGGYVGGVDPVTGEVSNYGTKTNTAFQDASLSLDRQRLAAETERRKAEEYRNRYKFDPDIGGYVPTTPGSPIIPVPGVKPNPKLTESEGKNTLYLSQMRDASNTLSTLEEASPAMVAATGNAYTNWIAGKNAQKVGQTQRQWAEAYLRAKTGAAATAGEVDNNIRTFFPVVGDDPETIAQKKAARAQAERDMEIPAGRGAERATASNAGASPAGAKVASMADIQETARRSGKTTAEVTAALKAKGYTVK